MRARRTTPHLEAIGDVRPITEFRASASQFIGQVQQTGEPVIFTQHGRSAAVLVDIGSYGEGRDCE